jgi:hypothetical protein
VKWRELKKNKFHPEDPIKAVKALRDIRIDLMAADLSWAEDMVYTPPVSNDDFKNAWSKASKRAERIARTAFKKASTPRVPLKEKQAAFMKVREIFDALKYGHPSSKRYEENAGRALKTDPLNFRILERKLFKAPKN